MKAICKLLVLLLLVSLVLPAHAQEQSAQFRLADPPEQIRKYTDETTSQTELPPLQHPTRRQIVKKWKAVTTASSIFAKNPSVSAPYSTGALTEDFLESGLTYLNYVRFVAGLPEVTLDDGMNENAQYGAVLLAANDNLTHYPDQPADMPDDFYSLGYAATTSSNLSARWGSYNQVDMLKSSILGCMDDTSSLNNLTTVGHRRWLLNPEMGKVGFGYARSTSGASYIVTKVFDWSGAGCDFDYISWPASGHQPTDLFDVLNPWSVTLNTRVYDYADVNDITITLTRKADGKKLVIDSSSGDPSSATPPYLIVNHNGYDRPNCIIFRPNVDFFNYGSNYEGIYEVKITGLYYTDGTAAELNYKVNFFDVASYSKTMHLDAPEVKIANDAATGKPKLTWDAVEDAAKYEVYRATSKNGTYKKLITVSGTSVVNTSAEAGKTYYYKVRSVDEDGKKFDFSNIVSRTCDLPRPEVTLTCIASSGKIKLSWEPVEGAKKYEVYRSTDKQNWTKLITTTGTSLTNSSAEAGTLYYYRVRAIHENSAANSAYSAIKSKRCDLPRPVITLSNIASTGKIMISWKPIEGAVKYQVYRSTDNENWTRLITTTGTSLTNSSAEAGVLYYYKVRAIASNSEANSAYSTVKSRTCDLAQPVLTVELNAAGKPYLTWEALDGAVKYRVDRSTDGENWTRLITTTGTKLTNSSAEAGITYYYRSFAISSNSSANSAYSEIVSITAG